MYKMPTIGAKLSKYLPTRIWIWIYTSPGLGADETRQKNQEIAMTG